MILPDYLAPGLDVVFSGTAAGSVSAIRGHYYAGPGNKFWTILQATGLTPELLTPEQDSRMTEYRLGLTDLVKEGSGADHTLPEEMFGLEAFIQKILRYEPRIVAFNGKEAARVFLQVETTRDVNVGPQSRMIGHTSIFVLPSTSAKAHKHWSDRPWYELAELLAARRQSESLDPARRVK